MRDEVESLVQSSDASEESSYDSRRGANNIAASARGNSNVMKNLKEDSETFCAINSVFVIFFVVSCVGVAVAAYAVTSDKEQQEFEEKFASFASKVADFSVQNTQQIFARMGLVGAEITSNALKSNAEWPWYTVPFFAQSAKALMVITSADFVGFSPIVTKETRFAWEQYVNETKPAVSSSLYNHEGPIPPQDPGPFVPCWQLTPEPENVEILNFDLQSVPSFSQGFTALQEGNSILSEPVNSTLLQGLPGVHLDSTDDLDEPRAFLMHPVYSNFSGEAEISGTLAALFRLQYLFRGTQDSRELGMVAVLRDSCGLNHTYNLNGPEVRYAGNTDLHDTTYDHLLVSVPFTDQLYEKNVSFVCSYTLDIYPSKSFESVYITNDPWVYTGVVVGIFFLLSLPLVFYNKMVKRRQDYLVGEAVRTTDILTNLFPSNVHKRLFGRTGEEKGRKIADQIKKQQNRDNMASSTQNRITERRPSGDKLGAEVINGMYTTKPIADLFPNTTIMFADMVGFTAWSSEREPAHVFTLLETLFGAFDAIAKRMDVFKVETIGDCYVAVAGLPHSRNDHAVVMAMFAKECIVKCNSLVRRMEITLGPDTGELSMRVGLHSGPVTAGVLRGERSRFQLFGDSVNTAARIETTGERGKIHISHETAELLISAGHSKWVIPRRDLVTAKGKGVMRTYWLVRPDDSNKSEANELDDEEENKNGAGEQLEDPSNLVSQGNDSSDAWGMAAVGLKSSNRLVEWNVDVLYQLLTKVVTTRQAQAAKSNRTGPLELDLRFGLGVIQAEEKRQNDIEERAKTINIDPEVKVQLRSFVTLIASMYRDHPFHSFEHASHVMLSITKLLNRITNPPAEDIAASYGSVVDNEEMSNLVHAHTYGIASDALLQFSVAFAALIHDVDHAGVPNTQLIKEDINLAKKYRYKSVAEKHSIRLAWERLMDVDYRELRKCLCPNQMDMKQFRNFVVNTVMATDIADKELNAKRKDRWSDCFDDWPDDPTADDLNRKATIVIEHLIQASDVAHTMQHFQVFLKWNERLFYEVYGAFDSGRADSDPSEKWYEGEIGFYDFYIIPLAKKLGACGVFGVASDEYLNYAQENREKWKKEGKEKVEEWLQKYHKRKREKKGDNGKKA